VTVLAAPPAPADWAAALQLPGRRAPELLPAVAVGLGLSAVAAALIVVRPDDGPMLAAVTLVGGAVAVGLVVLLLRRPQLAAWGAVLLFATSSELKLRVDPLVGAAKDGYVLLLVGIALVHVLRRPEAVRRLRELAPAGAALAVLVGLYVLDPAGSALTSRLFATRLLVEVVVLLLIGLVLAPAATLRHLVLAMTVLLPAEAAVAWAQQLSGLQSLVYQWGYQYGAQVRISSGGSLRTSGTFEDPFQLAALAVLGVVLALFVASRWQAALLLPAAVAVLAATSVRTAVLQVGVLLVLWAVRRGWGRPAGAVAGVGALGAVLVLATTTSAVEPGARPEPLLLSLNGRSSAWSNAVDGWGSLLTGNGVGARGSGSTVTSTAVSSAPSYAAGSGSPGAFAGNPAFLDSSYAQVQSDVGIVGTLALLTALVWLGVLAVRRCRHSIGGVPWAVCGLLAVSMIDWIGRSSLASYSTGFLTLYVLGVLLGSPEMQRGRR
jgi:hypothetical protein